MASHYINKSVRGKSIINNLDVEGELNINTNIKSIKKCIKKCIIKLKKLLKNLFKSIYYFLF